MRVVCDACEAKYFVPDDKVKKAVIRLTCQKCGHKIVVRRDESGAAAGASELRARLGLEAGSGPRAAAAVQGTPADWYYSRDGQSYGPFSIGDLEAQFANEELGAECYVWHRDLNEWQPAHSTDPFRKHIAARHVAPTMPANPIVTAALADATANAAGHRAESQAAPSPRVRSLRDKLDNLDVSVDIEVPTKADLATQADTPAVDERADEEAPIDLDDDDILDIDVDVEEPAFALDDDKTDPADILLDDEAFLNSDVIDLDNDEDFPPGPRTSHGPNESDLDDEDDDLPILDVEDDVAGPPSAPLEPVEPPTGREERSMMIHIEHLRKHNRRRRVAALLLVLALISAGALIWWFVVSKDAKLPDQEERWEQGAALASAGGEVIGDEEFERMAPLEEFTMVEADPTDDVEGIDPENGEQGADSVEGQPTGTGDGEPIEGVDGTENGERDPTARRRRGHRRRRAGGDDPAEVKTSEKPRDDKPVRTGQLKERDDGSPALLGVRPSGSPTTGATSFGGGGRRSTVDLSDAEGVAKASGDRGSKYAGSSGRKVKSSERSQFTSGLKKVSKSVQECHKRQLKTGALAATKVYITISVATDGSVSKTSLDEAVRGTPFEKCLLSKADRWSFEPFEGKPVELRQGFVLE